MQDVSCRWEDIVNHLLQVIAAPAMPGNCADDYDNDDDEEAGPVGEEDQVKEDKEGIYRDAVGRHEEDDAALEHSAASPGECSELARILFRLVLELCGAQRGVLRDEQNLSSIHCRVKHRQWSCMLLASTRGWGQMLLKQAGRRSACVAFRKS